MQCVRQRVAVVPAIEENKLWAQSTVENVAVVQGLDPEDQAGRHVSNYILGQLFLLFQQSAANKEKKAERKK